ncbi:MAG: hypothetical protein J0M27_06390 [Sulfuritalea sp.]|nr:hypothetical protein [Sulfuritalea sp.]
MQVLHAVSSAPTFRLERPRRDSRSGNKRIFRANFGITPLLERAQDTQNSSTKRTHPMRIESVELVALPDAPAWQEKVYRAHLDTGEDMDLFQQHWDVPLPPESLVGLTVEEARVKRNERMFAIASGNH